MMKRFSALALTLMMAFSLAGCWGAKSQSKAESKATSNADKSGVVSDITSGADSAMSKVDSAVGSMVDPDDSMAPDNSIGSHATDDSILDSSSVKPAAAAAGFPEGEWSLRLVNAQNTLPEDFAPETTSIPGYDSRPFDSRAAYALTQMLDAAEAAGNKLYLVSSYRSIERQTALFQRKTNQYKAEGLPQEQAEAEAAKLVARPGQSEHNLGLAADIVSSDWYTSNTDLTEAFENTEAFAWLQQNAASYGFILRYPKDKQAITGVSYEPWHYRYVGPSAAAEIAKTGITLEEYCQQKGFGA